MEMGLMCLLNHRIMGFLEHLRERREKGRRRRKRRRRGSTVADISDLKPAFERHKKQNTSPKSIDQVQTSPKRQEETIKIHEKKQLSQRQRKDENTFNVKQLLTAEQYGKFGERFPQKFKRMGLLGRGGFSLVWLGVHKNSRRRVAVKQILSKNPHETHLKQIWFCSYFFQKGGQIRQEFKDAIGINNICRLYNHEIEKEDSWLYYQLCEQSLGSCLFDLKGQNFGGERIFRIQYGELISRMRKNPKQLTKIVVEIAKALTLINSHNIVHSDLKTENIMIKTRKGELASQQTSYVRNIKLIDFGSSFLFTNLRQFSMATPEYMPPQILNYILFQNEMEHDPIMLKKMGLYKNAWIIDIWSLGCIILEIISGIPLWMSVKTRTPSYQNVIGLFAVKNRVFSKIIQKQIEIVQDLDFYIKNYNFSGVQIGEEMRKVLKGMLCLQPMKRISPWEVLNVLGVACSSPIVPSY